MNTPAPLALFTYRRTDSLERVLDSLEACPEFKDTPVFIFSDNAKTPAATDDVAAVRCLVKARLRPNMTIVEAPENAGLARSIIKGVTRLCNEYGRAIVIEDDLIVSPHILTWFNAALDRFENEPRVMQVSGYTFPGAALTNNNQGCFLPMTTSWGWATWGRAWDGFLPNSEGWEILRTRKETRRRFNLDGVYPYSKMLERQMSGAVDSWAIRWYWSVFRQEGLGLFPPASLVINIGQDDFATHDTLGKLVPKIFRPIERFAQQAPALPPSVVLDQVAWRRMKRNIIIRRILNQ